MLPKGILWETEDILGQTWGDGRDEGPGMIQSMELQRVGIKENSPGFSYVLKFCHSY